MTMQKKIRNAKYRVVPGLSISNRELRERVTNRSIVIDPSGLLYTTDPAISKVARGSTIQNARDYVANASHIATMKKAIQESHKKLELLAAREEGRKSVKSVKSEKGGENE